MNYSDFAILNDKLIDSSKPFLFENRNFKYGDGIFESIRVINGKVFNIENHITRLFEAAKVLSFDVENSIDINRLKSNINLLLKKKNIVFGGRIRLSVFRKNGGFYKPSTNDCSYLITAEPLPTNLFKMNKEGLQIEIFNEVLKYKDVLSNFKTSNALTYILAGNYANKKQLDDCLILNNERSIIESISSNIFLVSNGVLYTPPLADGCVGGTMRMHVINIALKNKLKVYETSLLPKNLMMADEIFFTNAIKGIQWVGAYKSKRYFNTVSNNILRMINENEANLKMDLIEN